MSYGPNVIHECRRTAESTRMDTPRLPTLRIGSALTSRRRSGCWRERKAARDVIGYCGLIDSGRGSDGEPELAFELLRRVWRQGYATEASLAVLDWARSSGYERLWATVREWNTASRRVLAKVGFTETERKELDSVYGNSLSTTRRL
jgi:ribosomal-protein-alanine N-acetyltransferase